MQASPEHEIHQLKPFPSEEAVPIGWQHEAGTQSVEEVLHHLLLLGRGRVVALEHLTGSDDGQLMREREHRGNGAFRTDQRSANSFKPQRQLVKWFIRAVFSNVRPF